jgi:hypothetical protein
MDRADGVNQVTAEKRNGDVSIELNSFGRLLKLRLRQNYLLASIGKAT